MLDHWPLPKHETKLLGSVRVCHNVIPAGVKNLTTSHCCFACAPNFNCQRNLDLLVCLDLVLIKARQYSTDSPIPNTVMWHGDVKIMKLYFVSRHTTYQSWAGAKVKLDFREFPLNWTEVAIKFFFVSKVQYHIRLWLPFHFVKHLNYTSQRNIASFFLFISLTLTDSLWFINVIISDYLTLRLGSVIPSLTTN